MPTIIFIEDDKKKIEKISDFVISEFQNVDIVVKESYQSGLRQLLNNSFDLLLLDMSMPTFERSIEESGGAHEKFAGHLILKEIYRKKRPIKTILITMFDVFPVDDYFIPLSVISDQLRQEFSEYFVGTVFYNSQDSKWQADLKNMIISNNLL